MGSRLDYFGGRAVWSFANDYGHGRITSRNGILVTLPG